MLVRSLLAFSSTAASAFISVGHRPHSYRASRLAMSSSPPTKYLLRYEYVPDVLEKRGPFREEHLKLAKEFCSSGGPSTPLGQTVPTGALFIFDTVEQANAFVEQDPYVTGGIVTSHVVETWTVAVEN